MSTLLRKTPVKLPPGPPGGQPSAALLITLDDLQGADPATLLVLGTVPYNSGLAELVAQAEGESLPLAEPAVWSPGAAEGRAPE